MNSFGKDSLTKGTFYLTISTFVFVASSYFINIWLGRFLGPSSYGVYGIIVSLMTVINLMQTTGLPLAVSKFIAEDESKADSVLKSGLTLQVISTLLASILLYTLAGFISGLLNDPTLEPYIKTTALIFPLYGIYSIYTNYYNGLHKFKTQAFMNIIYSLSKLISVFCLVYLFSVYGVIFGFVVAPLVALLFYFHLPKKTAQIFPFKKLINFSIPLIAIAVFTNLLQSIDLFLVQSQLQSDKLTGIYTANQNIAELPFYGITAIASVLFPSISKSTSNRLDTHTKELITRSIRFTLLILTPSVLLVAITSDKIISFLYSSSYLAGSESLSILAIGSGFFTLFIILSTIISSSGQPKVSTVLSGIGLILTTFLCYLLIPRLGLTGGALATSISSFAMALAAGIIIYGKFKVFASVRSIFNILCASFIIMYLTEMTNIPASIIPLLYLAMGCVYIASLYILREFSNEDIRLIKSLVPAWILQKMKQK